MPYSYHSHSGQFCHHGYGELEQVVQQAIEKKFKIYGLTEHMPRFDQTELYPEELEASCTPETLFTTFDAFVTEAKRLRTKYKHQIELLIGSEIEYIHPNYTTHVNSLQQQWTLDYIVGSLHHIGSIPIDYSPELYQQALLSLAQNDIVILFEKYFDEQWEMLSTVQPQVVGHFDLVRIFATQEQSLTAFNATSVWRRIERNIDYVISYGGLFEINSRAWKKGLQDAYPQRDIIKMIQSKGGKFTLSDDCHGPNDVGMYYDKLYDYLTQLDIKTIHYLSLDDNRQLITKEHSQILDDPFWQLYRK
ncbi:polymerase/histidinol phosphatase-like protein [Halteromyces radiatus]|uniref:polymerase/histidinol phosphatase-like protein n=1 Tax=Halteromyces radiatus TaxID=101107 RepID=UPI00221E7C5E|nr:polymerase/histidinol phosphatase-like protein [Halteromyces radiatus]KAI8096226.1 polymerase/histidinol phosphatase-like protein [Halteromyces radiatus]